MKIILVNILTCLSIIFRIWAIKITINAIATGEYEEANPISRKWFKIGTKTFYAYNIFWFLYTIIAWNTIMILEPDWYIVVFINALIIFGYTIVDLLWDCLCLWRLKNDKV